MSSESIKDPVFGELTSHTGGCWWADLTPKHRVIVFFCLEGGEGLVERLPFWHAIYASIRVKEWEYRLATAAWLVDLFNGAWLQPGQKKETRDSFASKLELDMAVMLESGCAELYYHDRLGNVAICAYLDADGTFRDAYFLEKE